MDYVLAAMRDAVHDRVWFAKRLILRHKTCAARIVVIRATAAAVACIGIAVGLASPAWADERLDGDYTFTNGATVNTWTITTQCNAEVTCGGTVSSSTGMVAAISRLTGGPWIVETARRLEWMGVRRRQ